MAAGSCRNTFEPFGNLKSLTLAIAHGVKTPSPEPKGDEDYEEYDKGKVLRNALPEDLVLYYVAFDILYYNDQVRQHTLCTLSDHCICMTFRFRYRFRFGVLPGS